MIGLLGEYHRLLGEIIDGHDGTLERFTGDGAMVFFNDPFPCAYPADRAVRMALEITAEVRLRAARWHRLGFDLALGTGIAQGYATLGRIGYEGRYDYAAIGSVTNQAARLCADAEPWQMLVPDRLVAACPGRLRTEPVGTRRLKGFARPVEVHDVEAFVGLPPERQSSGLRPNVRATRAPRTRTNALTSCTSTGRVKPLSRRVPTGSVRNRPGTRRPAVRAPAPARARPPRTGGRPGS